MPGEGSRAVSVPVAMRLLGVSRPKLRHMIDDGLLTVVNIGGNTIRITMKSIDELLGDVETVETKGNRNEDYRKDACGLRRIGGGNGI